MTCHHCCDANKFFDIKNAQKELKKYKKKGASGTSKRIIKALQEIDVKDKTLLDIGGGIGMLQWYFLENGAKATVDVDASAGYLEVAEEYAVEREWKEKASFVQGDFNDFTNDLNCFDVVTLDRVVCCYPNYEMILRNATLKCNQYLVLSYPLSNWISKFLNKMSRIYFLFKKSEFKTYIHPSKAIEQLIGEQGFVQTHRSIKFPWHIQIYKKAD